jgi:16S rRNA (guanine527-N7)-methyltransferase
VHNLVARSTLTDVWTRHVADSLQLLDHAPDFREWVDLGSGAGFPGLVVAIACKGFPERHFTLVESNRKKAAFLRAAIRESGANAVVAAERIEEHARTMRGRADVVSARALAPLGELCGLALPYLHPGSVLLLLKGQDFVHEHEIASKSWSYDMVTFPSTTDPAGRVVVIRNLARR